MRVEIGAWLRGLHLQQYEQVFRENAVATQKLYRS